MPYVIQQVAPRGYKVCKETEPTHCFSKKPLPKKTATKQRIAIIISEKQRETKDKTKSKKK